LDADHLPAYVSSALPVNVCPLSGRRELASLGEVLPAQLAPVGDSAMLDYAWEKLLGGPDLVLEHYSGRTLLHAASAAGNVTTVELLLRLGVNPNITDAGGHTSLYCVGNECKVKTGGNVVRILVHAGAKVDAHDGAKHCTALHMAARRGNVNVAEALLDCGANIEARDSLGDTPLRRSVNCDQAQVARLLVTRGADVHSRGSKGVTPLLAARTGTMRQILQTAAKSNAPNSARIVPA
jgi:ankyrin repeat protein